MNGHQRHSGRQAPGLNTRRPTMNTTTTYDARYDLPTPLFDEDGSGACHPSDENETGP